MEFVFEEVYNWGLYIISRKNQPFVHIIFYSVDFHAKGGHIHGKSHVALAFRKIKFVRDLIIIVIIRDLEYIEIIIFGTAN